MIVVSLPASPLPLWHQPVHLIHYWCYYCELQPKCQNGLSHFPILVQKKKKKRKKRISPSHSAAFRLRGGCFLLSLEILQLQLRSWFRGGCFAPSRHISSVSWCMSARSVKRTLSRSDWNWNHFIMRHYGKCRASEWGGNKYCQARAKRRQYTALLACVIFSGGIYCGLDSFCSAV